MVFYDSVEIIPVEPQLLVDFHRRHLAEVNFRFEGLFRQAQVRGRPGDRQETRDQDSRVDEPRENRIVIFEVTPASLHQVREVVRGARVSLSGWFLG